MTNKASRLSVVALLVALAAAGAGIFAARQLDRDPVAVTPAPQEYKVLKNLPEPRILADFALVDQHGEPFNLARWQDRWNLVFFGFTYCPDICPGTLHLLSGVLEAVGADPGALGVTFISVDPERDSPEQLAKYTSFYGPSMEGVTGPEPQLVALGYQLGLVFEIEPHAPGATDYAVDHSAAVVVVGPDGRYHGQFQAPHDPEAIAQDLRSLLSSEVAAPRD
ncbi:MAG: SCO family protein [Pseudomonadota bacterium]